VNADPNQEVLGYSPAMEAERLTGSNEEGRLVSEASGLGGGGGGGGGGGCVEI